MRESINLLEVLWEKVLVDLQAEFRWELLEVTQRVLVVVLHVAGGSRNSKKISCVFGKVGER